MREAGMRGWSVFAAASRFEGCTIRRIGISAIVSLSLLAMATSSLMALEIGEPFPIVLLPSLEDGSPMSITEFRGKKLVLHIWAAW
jgi:hypothetical protein